ncbi:MAG: flagellar FlbD family protein [Spirochaetia bacterium]
MIKLTIQGKLRREIFLNPHMIETIECHPDTTIILMSGKVIVVAEDYSTVYKKIMEYRRSLVHCENEE